MSKVLSVLIFVFGIVLFSSTAYGQSTTWLKGGVSIFGKKNQGSILSHDIPEDLKISHPFFIQMSPASKRGNLNDSKSLGYRFEPWIGYSQATQKFSPKRKLSSGPNDARVYDFDITLKSVQFGTNLFLDYKITQKLQIYSGPMVGFEINKASGKYNRDFINRRGKEIFSEEFYNSRFAFSFFYGGEAGIEYSILPNISIGAFGAMIQHAENVYSLSNLQIKPRGEIRAGMGLSFHWK